MAVAGVVGVLVGALQGPAQAAPTVQALWNMDSLPTMVDSAGGDNNGSTKNVTMAAAGQYKFNGTSSLATVPDKDNLDPGTATIKLSARVSFTTRPALNGTYDLIRKGLSFTAGGEYKIEIRRSSTGAATAACTFKDANNRLGTAFGSVDLAGKGFQVITCIKTATSIQLIAGGQTKTTAASLGSIKNTAPVYVGGKGDGTDEFPGIMDYVKIEIG